MTGAAAGPPGAGTATSQRPRIPHHTGWRRYAQTVVARAYPRLIGQLRERSWMFFEVFLPLMAVSAYVFVYRAIRAPEAFTGFAVFGGAMTAFWLNVLWSMSSHLYWEKEQGNLALYIMAPAPLSAILLGMALGGMLSTTLRVGVILILGSFLFHVHYAVSSFGALLGVFALAMVALYGLGMMTASLFLLLGREAWHFSHMLQEPIYLFSGFYFPLRSFNFWVAAGASIIPLTLGLDAMRQLIFPTGASVGFLPVRVELALLAGLAAAFLAAARVLLGHMERLAIRDGRLTESRK